ncbi:MAG: 16S rRNA (guanine(966)-N(2))-methyltransferase RsmD [Gammaproteobacteria bacterium]|jgi:16S rRNA (guanine966-N2)-methyltransferase
MPGRIKSKRNAQVRIIGGRWKGRRIPVYGDGVRPTGDRIRETLFNWLAPHIRGVRCLDMYAGTGALGIEALSRGAGAVVFIEKNPRVAQLLRETLATLDGEGAEVVTGNAASALKALSGRFDLVFLDPPFDGPRLQDLCTLLEKSDVLAKTALIYMEMDKHQALPELPSGWLTEKERIAGQVRYVLASRTAAVSE